jgi:exopolysaccharide biosynthesis protein
VDTAKMIADGVKYAVTGWGKVIDNFAPCSDTVENEIVHSETYIRQVIGQFQNGDYMVCTVDKSRGNVLNEAGLTYADLAQLLVDKGVKFAYSLDGGGSAETVIGKRQLNPIYEGTVGRSVPTVITFEY